MFNKIRTTWRVLTGQKEEIKPPFGYEVVLKNKQTGQILFCGVVSDYALTDKDLWIAPEDGDELDKLRITLSGDELIFMRELENKEDFFSREFNPNSCRPSDLSSYVFWY